jgi:hypothetical protein
LKPVGETFRDNDHTVIVCGKFGAVVAQKRGRVNPNIHGYVKNATAEAAYHFHFSVGRALKM